jgi:hypothetical protein
MGGRKVGGRRRREREIDEGIEKKGYEGAGKTRYFLLKRN